MKKITLVIIVLCICCMGQIVLANSAPVVSNVTVSQKTDGSGIVDIYYTLSDADNDRCTVSIFVSNDGGNTWTITPSASALDGHLIDVSSGRRHITWNSKTDLPGTFGTNYKVIVTADDKIGPAGMAWVYINDPGFTGYMSKYETTNAQYCEYLNEAYPSQIKIENGVVYALGDISNDEPYCKIYPEGSIYSLIEFSEETFSVRNRDNYSMANHPVVEVSRYGAIAFCDVYDYRLPGIWEWQAVADFDGSYIYGCGTAISQSVANYDYANPLGLSSPPYTSPVGYYPDIHGYKVCDMAGNVFEWTSHYYNPPSGGGPLSIFHGGSHAHSQDRCKVLYGSIPDDVMAAYPYSTHSDLGFRVCR